MFTLFPKDAFDSSALKAVEEFLYEIYSIYQTFSKRYCKWQRIAVAYGEAIPKLTKACKTRWIDHKLRAMMIGLDHYGPI